MTSAFLDAFYSNHPTDAVPVPRAPSSEQLMSTNGFFQVTANRPHGSLNATSARHDLYDNPCYGKLLWLYYIFSLEILVDVVFEFTEMTYMTFAETLDSTSFNQSEVMLLAHVCHVATVIVLLWLWILIFMDPDLQRVWKRGRMGRIMRKKPISIISWTLLVVVMLVLSFGVMALITFHHGQWPGPPML